MPNLSNRNTQSPISKTRRKAGNASGRQTKAVIHDDLSKAELKPETLGQVFTPPGLVNAMLTLRKSNVRVLEPSCGSGAFSNSLNAIGVDLVALELDADHAPAYALVSDFFDYPEAEKFQTIIGNPPYLRHQDIPADTKRKLDMSRFDGRTNLFYFFIEKCVKHLEPGGELIFVVPRDFPKATAARRLNQWLFQQGSITDFWETGDEKLFKGATPPCCVFRFEKGRMNRAMNDGRRFHEHRGQLFFLASTEPMVPFAEFFTVAVGGLTGNDELYESALGNVELVCSKTRKTGATRKMLHGDAARTALAPHKKELMARRVKNFTEANWWHWGRQWKQSGCQRVYVNSLVRQRNPFFTHPCEAYDGSVLALFPNDPAMDVQAAARILNEVDWASLGFMAGKRLMLAQAALQDALIPASVAAKLRAACQPKSQPLAA